MKYVKQGKLETHFVDGVTIVHSSEGVEVNISDIVSRLSWKEFAIFRELTDHWNWEALGEDGSYLAKGEGLTFKECLDAARNLFDVRQFADFLVQRGAKTGE